MPRLFPNMLCACLVTIAVFGLVPAAAAKPGKEAEQAWSEGAKTYRAGDMAATRKHFSRACSLGHERACFNVGVMYQDGVGGAADPEHARWLFNKACQFGYASGCYNFGNMAMEGKGGARDDIAARKAQETACTAGVTQACNSLAVLVEAGRGGNRDMARALALYKTACDGGHKAACDNIAAGAGVSLTQADYRMGLDYFSRKLYANAYPVLRPFADRGDAQAQYSVGWMLAYGQGTNRDYLDAARFLVSAARKGDKDAENILRQIAPKVREAEFVYLIDSEGPDMSSLANFAYEVEVYCRFGGKNCTTWKQRYQQAENANNSRAFSEQMARAWNQQSAPDPRFGNDPRRSGETFGACIRRQVRTRGATAGSTVLDYDCY